MKITIQSVVLGLLVGIFSIAIHCSVHDFYVGSDHPKDQPPKEITLPTSGTIPIRFNYSHPSQTIIKPAETHGRDVFMCDKYGQKWRAVWEKVEEDAEPMPNQNPVPSGTGDRLIQGAESLRWPVPSNTSGTTSHDPVRDAKP